MKLLIIGILSSLLTLCVGCGDEIGDPSDKLTFTYENETGFDLKLTGYRNESSFREVNIPNSASVSEIVVVGTGSSDPSIAEADSVVVEFEDGKTLYYGPNNASSTNLTMWQNYHYEKVKGKEYFTYQFTQIDYDLARGPVE